MDVNKIISKGKSHIVFFTVIFLILFFGYLLVYFGYNNIFYIKNDWIHNIFQVITYLGDPRFFIIVFSIFYFSIDKDFGKNLLYIFLFSAYINTFLKLFIRDPRPSTNTIEKGFGFPSGHSQISVSFWGYIFYCFKKNLKKNLIQSLCIFIIIIVSFSRLVLGVHDVVDVFAGIIIGLFVLEIYILIKPKFAGFKNVPLNIKVPFFGIFGFLVWYLMVYLFPFSFNEIGQVGGILFSALVFIPIEEKFIDYTTDFFDIRKKIIIAAFAIFIIFLVFFLVNYILNQIIDFNYIFVFIEYILMGFFIFLFVPFILKRAINHYY